MGAQFRGDCREAFEREDQQRERGRVFANVAAEGAREHVAQSDGQSPTCPQAFSGSVLSELADSSVLSAAYSLQTVIMLQRFAGEYARSSPTLARGPKANGPGRHLLDSLDHHV